ncbi:HAD family hydrolase [Nonlabens spongiae]|uniref:HAD family hydrolase n=1 Tax=Nonlabens spongiae TaxID=331648 RepID=A0A1W6MKV6_9FLAO|nr:Cof-type HAD-IIB family hydrolase [Nonlabens spongiae]ARN78225.1 HAD family hydrolase [Nonlabens spongiae]
MIKLIATDIDGTLLDQHRSISDHTAATFKIIDLPKILISARMPQAMYYLQEMLDIAGTPIICYNGALVLDRDEVLYNLHIPFEQIETLAATALEHDLHISLYRKDEWFVTAMDQWAQREVNNTRVQPTVQDLQQTLDYFENTRDQGGAHKVMLMGDMVAMDSAFAKAEQQLGNQVHLYRSKDTYTEITPAGTSKKKALELLLKERFQESGMEHVAAFGDNYNDTEMLQAVGYGVAVANGRDEVKQAARYIADHHKKDGVALWLQENL